VTITKPEHGDEFNPDDTIEIEADVLDFDGFVVMVEFLANGTKIAEDTDGSDGWKTSWTDHPEDSYTLTAQAKDNEGAATTSQAVVITVVEEHPPPPWPPLPPGLPPPGP
jgi:chitinase